MTANPRAVRLRVGGSTMRLTAPLFISTRLMAAVKVGDRGGTLHISPENQDGDGRIVWRYIIEDGNRAVLDEGTGLRSGVRDPVDPRKAMSTLVGFLGAAAEAYRTGLRGGVSENAGLFSPDVAEWAYTYDDELGSLGLELEEPEIEAPAARHPSKPFIRPAGRGDPIPIGWTVESVGEWNGQQTEVVYDPRLHDVMVVQTSMTEDREGDLAAQGWAYEGTDGYSVIWVRDRLSAGHAALDRTANQPELEVGQTAEAMRPPSPEIGGR